jgi:hypothetical protein
LDGEKMKTKKETESLCYGAVLAAFVGVGKKEGTAKKKDFIR